MKTFSLFSGVGGFEQGFPKEWEIIGFSEIDKYASMVLNYHYPKVKNYGNITSIKWNEIPDFDLLTGGSPCQDFSIAGNRAGIVGSRSGLVWEYIRCLREKQPRYFIWENVKGVMSSRGGWDFANILTAFSESGYSLWWQVLNAKDFGVPQNRERIFVCGFRNESPTEVFFEREISEKSNDEQWDISSDETEKCGRGSKHLDCEDGENGQRGQLHTLNKGASQHYRVYGKEGLALTLQSQSGFSSQKHPFVISSTQKHATVTENISSALPSAMGLGGGHIPMVVAQRGKNPKNPKSRKSGLPTKQMLEPNLNGTSNALSTVEKDNYVYDGKIRKLMPIECERLMSWKDNWTKFGRNEKGEIIEISDSQRYKMCGNGVVSNVIKVLVDNFIDS